MPDAVPHDLTIKKLVDATTVVPEVDDEVLVFSHEGGANDSIWIDMGAPVRHASEGARGYVLTQPEHAATNDANADTQRYSFVFDGDSRDSGYVSPASFQIISAGADGEYGSRLFVGNLTMRSEASNEPGVEVLVSDEEDVFKVPAVQTGAWIADVTYERVASERAGDALSTQTISPSETIGMESVHALYDLVV